MTLEQQSTRTFGCGAGNPDSRVSGTTSAAAQDLQRQRRVNRRALDRREVRVREAEKAIRWTLDYFRMGTGSRSIRRAAETLVDGSRQRRKS